MTALATDIRSGNSELEDDCKIDQLLQGINEYELL